MTYTCPMHPEIQSNKKGKCPTCGMALVEKSSISQKEKNSYTPLLIIILLIILTSLSLSLATGLTIRHVLTTFMALFFFVFSGFKLANLKGFAEGYSMYDLLAKKFYPYGFFYPFIELFFAIAMLLQFHVTVVLFAEIFIMAFSGIGVTIKIAKHEKFQCVCLGTFLKVPLTTVTLVEDFGMTVLGMILLLVK
ncbi:MAG: heavy metal-binding domain-containing protein [Candidatus Levyibacteriota bacterium]